MKKIAVISVCVLVVLAVAVVVVTREPAINEENAVATREPPKPAMSASELADFIKLCQSGTPQEVEAAIKAGADVNAKTYNGETPLLHAARYNNNPEVLDVLIKAGADVNAKSDYSKTPLMYAAQYNNNSEVLDVLIKAGADINAKDNISSTPLILAAWGNENPEVLRILIEAGADVNARYGDDDSGTALANAAFQSKPEIVSLLLASGADVTELAARYAQNNERLKGTAVLEELLTALSASQTEAP